MDVSMDSSASEEETLEAKISRLNRNFQDKVDAARRADPEWDQHPSPHSYIPGPAPTLSLRLPTPSQASPLFAFEDERFSEELNYSYHSNPDNELLRKEVENACMRAEDLASYIFHCSSQTLSLSISQVQSLRDSLTSCTPGDILELSLGAFQFRIIAREPEEDLAAKYTKILDATEEMFEEEMIRDDRQEVELAATASGGDGETEETFAAKVCEFQTSLSLFLEQKRALELREESLQSLEFELKSQTEDLAHLRQELESALSSHHTHVEALEANIATLKEEVEGLLVGQLEANLKFRYGFEEKQIIARREQYEREFIPLKETAYAYMANGLRSEELQASIDLAEKEFADAILTGKPTKYKAKLSSLSSKLTNIRMMEAVNMQTQKTQVITSTLKALSTSPKSDKAKANVQHRVAARFSTLSTASRSIASPTRSDYWSGAKSPVSLMDRSSVLSHTSTDLQSFRTYNCGSPTFESNESSHITDSATLALLKLAESSAERWRNLAFVLNSKLRGTENKEIDLNLAQSRLQAWEKRLSAIEKSLLTRESAVADRESKVSAKEDAHLIRVCKMLTPVEAKKLADLSYTEVHKERAGLEELRNDLFTTSQHLDSQTITLTERKCALDLEIKSSKAYRDRLSDCAKAVDTILDRFARFMPRLKVNT